MSLFRPTFALFLLSGATAFFLGKEGVIIPKSVNDSQDPPPSLGVTAVYYTDSKCTNPSGPPIDVKTYCNESYVFPTGPAYTVGECLYGDLAQKSCNASKCVYTCNGPTPDGCLTALSNPTNPPKNSGCYLVPADVCISSPIWDGGSIQFTLTCDSDGPPAPPAPKPTPFELEWTGATVQVYTDPYCEYQAKEFQVKGNCTTQESLPPQPAPLYWQAGYLTGKQADIYCEEDACVVACAAMSQNGCNNVANAPQGPFNAKDEGGCGVLTINTCSLLRAATPSLPALYGRVLATGKPTPPDYPPHPNPVPPMVFIGGLTTSLIQYKLDDATPIPFTKCATSTNGEWKTLWPSPTKPEEDNAFVCQIANLEVSLDEDKNQYVPRRKGLQTRLIDIGGFNGMPMFSGLIPEYERAGWRINETLFGVPYDWRIPTNSQNGPGEFFENMKNVVEMAYNKNNNQKVTIVAPSLGPQYILGFLHRMTQEWKDKYVDWYIMISPVNSGSPEALIAYVSGSPEDAGATESLIARILGEEFARSVPVLSWLFPRAGNNSYTYGQSDPLIITPTKNYTASDYVELFKDMRQSEEQVDSLKFNVEEPDLHDYEFPGVNIYITYGYNITTLCRAYYNTSLTKYPQLPVKYDNCDGDGIVPVRSSERFYEWASNATSSGKKVLYKAYLNQPHAACITPTFPGDDGQCFYDFLGLILNGTTPAGAKKL
eukprot:m.34744 g.34744  ORF g.34744 m.34744 type:complete len:713 (+) comp8772_c1_seq1:76-2214(+)